MKNVKKTDNNNKNSFEVLGLIDEEVIIRMEEDDKGDKIGAHLDDQISTHSAIDDNSLNHDLIHSMGIRKDDLEMVNAEKKMDNKRKDDSSKISGSSQAFEVVNAKNRIVIQ